MFEIWLNTFLILFVLGNLTILANLAERERRLQIILFVSILGLNGLLVFYPVLAAIAPVPVEEPAAGSLPLDSADDSEGDEPLDLGAEDIIPAVLIGLLGAGAASLFMLEPVRVWLATFLPKTSQQIPPQTERFPMINLEDGRLLESAAPAPELPPGSTAQYGFNPQSPVQLWAGVMVIHFLAFQLISFFLAGGISGIAEDIGVNYGILVANFIPTVTIPVLGVGLFLRRSPRQVLHRLGLTRPTLKSFAFAFASTIMLLMVVFTIAVIWELSVSEETFEEQTEASNALAESVTSVGLAFVLALTASVGEEIAFRGALQPVFGFWFTAIVFVLAHLQYTLTPASLIILFVAVMLGLIRKYFDTTTAILTHFLYNFIPLALPLIFSEPAWIHLL